MIELSIDPNGGIDTDGYVPPPLVSTGYSTGDYELVTTVNAQGIRVYQVRNTKYGITEYEDHLLWRILDMMQDMQAHLDSSVKKYVPPMLTLVEKEDEEGEARIH